MITELTGRFWTLWYPLKENMTLFFDRNVTGCHWVVYWRLFWSSHLLHAYLKYYLFKHGHLSWFLWKIYPESNQGNKTFTCYNGTDSVLFTSQSDPSEKTESKIIDENKIEEYNSHNKIPKGSFHNQKESSNSRKWLFPLFNFLTPTINFLV